MSSSSSAAASSSPMVADLALSAQPFDVSFHPTQKLFCSALISGAVDLYSYDNGQPEDDDEEHQENHTQKRLWRKKGHRESCRAARFTHDGLGVVSASADKSLLCRDTHTGQQTWRVADAHEAAVNRLSVVSESVLASGDDSGVVKVWDMRCDSGNGNGSSDAAAAGAAAAAAAAAGSGARCCATVKAHDDFVADMHRVESAQKLLTVSGDGTLAVIDLRRRKREALSEWAEDELLSVTTAKNGRKVVCGSQDGILLLYSWGHFKDCSDRFPGHPESVDTIVKVNEDLLLTGSQDGYIRLVSILPNRFLGIVNKNQSGGHEAAAVEHLALSPISQIVASASHDGHIRLWDISRAIDSSLAEDGSDEEAQDEDSDDEEEEDRVTETQAATKKKGEERGGKWSDEGSTEQDQEAETEIGAATVVRSEQGDGGEKGDNSDDDEQEPEKKRTKKTPQAKEGRKGKGKGKADADLEKRRAFFTDL